MKIRSIALAIGSAPIGCAFEVNSEHRRWPRVALSPAAGAPDAAPTGKGLRMIYFRQIEKKYRIAIFYGPADRAPP
jgi:hypothetical protein